MASSASNLRPININLFTSPVFIKNDKLEGITEVQIGEAKSGYVLSAVKPGLSTLFSITRVWDAFSDCYTNDWSVQNQVKSLDVYVHETQIPSLEKRMMTLLVLKYVSAAAALVFGVDSAFEVSAWFFDGRGLRVMQPYCVVSSALAIVSAGILYHLIQTHNAVRFELTNRLVSLLVFAQENGNEQVSKNLSFPKNAKLILAKTNKP